MGDTPVYFIGAGPGAAHFLTLQAVDCLRRCPVVYLMPPYDQTLQDHLAGKQLRNPFAQPFEGLIAQIEQDRQQGPVAFLLPGDLSFYCPFQPIIDRVGAAAQVIAGVGVANAASAALRRCLNQTETTDRIVLTSTRMLQEQGGPSLETLIDPRATLILYMNKLPLPQLVAALKKGYAADVPLALLSRIGLPDEKILLSTTDRIEQDVDDSDPFGLTDRSRPNLTLVVAGPSLAGDADHLWWNRQYETVWKERETAYQASGEKP